MNRKAFTLVELLVVIAIIGILIGMLVPAVQSARESSRRATCMNNIKQLGIGLTAYHTANGKFPPAMTLPFSENPNYTYNWGPNWVILILPYLDANPLYNKFNPVSLTLPLPTTTASSMVPISDSTNLVARSTTLSVMLCPTDIGTRTPISRGPLARMMLPTGLAVTTRRMAPCNSLRGMEMACKTTIGQPSIIAG